MMVRRQGIRRGVKRDFGELVSLRVEKGEREEVLWWWWSEEVKLGFGRVEGRENEVAIDESLTSLLGLVGL